jgi:CO dehydrogenase/acetyl-CoA synthase beta subunit
VTGTVRTQIAPANTDIAGRRTPDDDKTRDGGQRNHVSEDEEEDEEQEEEEEEEEEEEGDRVERPSHAAGTQIPAVRTSMTSNAIGRLMTS